MAKLYEILSQMMKEHKLTIYSVAKESGIERSMLSKILSGSRNLSIENFSAIINTINFSAEEAQLLRGEFINEYFGQAKFESYIDMIKKVAKLSEKERSSQGKIKISLEFDGDTISFDNTNDFINTAKAVINDAVGSGSRLYTNMSTDIVLDILKNLPKSKSEKESDFKIIIPVNTEEKMYGNTIYHSILFMLMGQEANYYRVRSDISEHLDVIFPNYIITDDICIFADAKTQNGYLIRNKAIADIYAEKFLEIIGKTESYLTANGDILEVKERHMQMLEKKIDRFYSIETSLCVAIFMDLNMWDQIARPEIPNRDFMRDSTYAYYKMFVEAPQEIHTIVSRQGLEEFSETGIITQIPAEMAFPMTVENRIKVLKNFVSFYRDNPNASFNIIKPQEYSVSYQIDTEIFNMRSEHNEMNLSISTNLRSLESNYVGNFSINISDIDTVSDFEEFTKCFIISGICYSQEESLSLVEEEIKKLEYHL